MSKSSRGSWELPLCLRSSTRTMQTTVAIALVTLSVLLLVDVGVAYPNPYFEPAKRLSEDLLDAEDAFDGDEGDRFEDENSLWRRAYSPISATDTSIKDYSSILSCSVGQVCKPASKSKFSCKCNIFTYCVAPGKYANAQCKWSAVGYVYKQP
ncbi:uncharacterized protein [Ptychodera flava]|uniref:uncharacterized protein isoform X1 n=2 Tax=Ptychodera flava TaxID=63121 RepID=UPI00396A5C1D